MAEVPQNVKFLLFGMGPKGHALCAFLVYLVGIVTIILGIVSAAIDNPIGLGAGNWFLLTIALFLWGIGDWLIAYFGAKEGYKQ